MTNIQYFDLCNIFGRKLTDHELKEMGFSAVDGKFDEELDYDIGLMKFDQFKRECRRGQR